MKHDIQISFRLPKELLALVDVESVRRGVTRGDVIRGCIKEALREVPESAWGKRALRSYMQGRPKPWGVTSVGDKMYHFDEKGEK